MNFLIWRNIKLVSVFLGLCVQNASAGLLIGASRPSLGEVGVPFLSSVCKHIFTLLNLKPTHPPASDEFKMRTQKIKIRSKKISSSKPPSLYLIKDERRRARRRRRFFSWLGGPRSVDWWSFSSNGCNQQKLRLIQVVIFYNFLGHSHFSIF